MIHRILGAWLDKQEMGLTPARLARIAEECSASERRADDAERELVEWKKINFMAEKVGDEFGGLIVNTAKFGFFVELEDLFVEGLVPVETLPGERFGLNENTRQIIGARSGTAYSIGDRVRVRLDRVDATERRLHFSLAGSRKRKRR
jgi:ribonuclease R